MLTKWNNACLGFRVAVQCNRQFCQTLHVTRLYFPTSVLSGHIRFRIITGSDTLTYSETRPNWWPCDPWPGNPVLTLNQTYIKLFYDDDIFVLLTSVLGTLMAKQHYISLNYLIGLCPWAVVVHHTDSRMVYKFHTNLPVESLALYPWQKSFSWQC